MTTNTEPQWHLDLTGAAAMPTMKFNDAVTGIDEAIVVFMAGHEEALKVTDKGFYVRGVKVEQDATEAIEVYNAFRQWLEWSLLNTQ
jgi:hypothetical protein